MKVGILGAGNIGATLARKLAAAGHEVKLAGTTPRGKPAFDGMKVFVEEARPAVENGENTIPLSLPRCS